MAKLHQLAEGQAIWPDYIRRSFITSGDLQALIDEGLRGVTSNPTIFERVARRWRGCLCLILRGSDGLHC